MPKVIYYAPFSPPARAVIITAKLINLDVELKFVDFSKKEHLSKEFIELNPQHTIPLFVDEGEPIWDSHAIICYMVSKYAPDESLYPKELLLRARIDQRLHFENGVLFQVIKDFVNRNIYGGESEFNPKTIDFCNNSYGFLEAFLVKDYVCGDTMTVADVSIQTTMITLGKLVPVDADKFPRITAWLKRMSTLPWNDENEKGAQFLVDRIKSVMESNKK